MGERKWRIAVGGIHIESSTFSPNLAGPSDFAVTRGDDLLNRYDSLPESARWLPLVHARAMPGGAVEAAFYDDIATEFLDRLRRAHEAEPLDGVYLDIHGAMSVDGRRDAEGRLAAEVRRVVGPDVLVSASMDPHGNVSRALVDNVDLLTSHRMSPHEDWKLTMARAQSKLVECLDAGVRPRRAWVTVPVLLPGEKACTRDDPAKRLYGMLPAIEACDGVVDAAIWIGYAWADEPRCQAAVVVSGTDTDLIQAKAAELARAWWDARAEFDFSTRATDADTAIAEALASPKRPFFVSDSGDNPTAGGSDDVPYFLGRLLATPELATGEASAIWVSVVAPDAVVACAEAGIDGEVECAVGGALGWGDTLSLKGRVVNLVDDADGGTIAVVVSGGVSAVLTSRRKAFHYIEDFTALGLDPAKVDLTVVKIGYLVPDLFDAAAGWVLALSPGGVDQHIVRLGHRHVDRPMYPLDPDMSDPDLTPVLI
ncbi:M81 family metallopeptidase [Stackebrandtia nassauensis]|uniref:Microcystin LR degradation protein MlrC-like protein n=1 Tax=Stackebrandtia nassauensis (strain DSM 44728 / CIP 108903 / NRRL B-16338 / NBRC 102104 / LLR-40K-21) TaxID=446470 RepID=D3PXF3_STANL|nr:M81 family metallopeptidase [Stackebrandtia nassauensis]ADD41416.1 Microcystin LR degradation protein MlrC-like protein [Stackebrandtia nassauensis DSM 44728]